MESMIENNMLEWLSKWYNQNCDGDWEHDFRVMIETLDNPGWSISIDTEGTSLRLTDRPWVLQENGPKDWYGYKVSNGNFEASGDPMKLQFLLTLFQNSLNDELGKESKNET